MSYEEEKKYLVKKAKEFLGDAEVVYLEDVNGYTDYLVLNYFGEPIETEIVALETFGDDISVRTYNEKYPDGADSSSLDEFSNDEIKRILELFGIDF